MCFSNDQLVEFLNNNIEIKNLLLDNFEPHLILDTKLESIIMSISDTAGALFSYGPEHFDINSFRNVLNHFANMGKFPKHLLKEIV